jgi:tetratricopeptide (TPR) repeat protein
MLRGFLAGLTAVTALSGLHATPSFAQEESDQRLGTVHFPTSCNETAQRRFDRGMRYQHSFWYRESRGIFEDVIKADPECGIAYWGIALSYLDNPHNPPPPANLPLGLAAIEKAKAVGAKTQRERDFIDALLVYYTDYDKVPHPARVRSYLKAIEAVAQRYPDDDEAQLFYGIALAKLIELRDKLREAKDAYWSEQVDIQAQIANAWVLFAEGKYEDALKAMSAAADAEDRTEKHPVTPGVPEPARELYGVMLLDRGMAREALAAFEATIRKEPNRLNAFLGAAKAAAATGDKDKARAYYQKLAALAESRDAGRPDLAAAREYLAKN